MKLFKKILKWFIILFLVIVFGGCISLFLAFNIMGYEVIQITGDDMEPDLYSGDVIVIKPVDISDVDIGDIITFQIGYNKITHKVVSKGNGTVSTQGSNLDTIDALSVMNDNIRGKVLTKLENGAHFIMFITNPGNMVIVICIVLGLLSIPLIMKVEEKENKDNKKGNNR